MILRNKYFYWMVLLNQLRITIFQFQDILRRTTLPTWYQRNTTLGLILNRHRLRTRCIDPALWHSLRVPPMSTVLFPGVGSCQMPPPSNIQPAMPPSSERSQAMKKWAEGRSHIQHLVDCDKTPPKEHCLLVFQFLCTIVAFFWFSERTENTTFRFSVFIHSDLNFDLQLALSCFLDVLIHYKFHFLIVHFLTIRWSCSWLVRIFTNLTDTLCIHTTSLFFPTEGPDFFFFDLVRSNG